MILERFSILMSLLSIVRSNASFAQPNRLLSVYRSFTENPVGGSAAAIISGDAFDPSQMQEIAKFLNVPATCFLLNIRENFVNVRFFSPYTEYPACGHGTIALFTHLLKYGEILPGQFRLSTPTHESTVDVFFGETMLHLDPTPLFHYPQESLIARMLCIGVNRITDSGLPVQIAQSKEFSHLLVPICDLKTIREVKPDFDSMKEASICDTIALFTLETEDCKKTVHVRDFCPSLGTPEAAATGTTNRAIACYLWRNGLIKDTIVLAEQGFEMGQPSLVKSEIVIGLENAIDRIKVGGLATEIRRGEVNINGTAVVMNNLTNA